MVLAYNKKIGNSMLCVTGVYLRVCLHFVCMGQKVNQRPLNSHYRYKADATDHSWLSSDLASWSLECAGILCHWAISAVTGAPSFWLCNWHEVYCGPIKTSIFKNQHFFKIGQILCFACYYYSLIRFRYHIIMLHTLFNPNIKELHVRSI